MQKLALKLLQLLLLLVILLPIAALFYRMIPNSDQPVVLDPEQDDYEWQQNQDQQQSK